VDKKTGGEEPLFLCKKKQNYQPMMGHYKKGPGTPGPLKLISRHEAFWARLPTVFFELTF